MFKRNNHKSIELTGKACIYSFMPYVQLALIRKISKFSHVYKGISSLGNDVVVKVLPERYAFDPVIVQCFKDEVHWSGKHENILAPVEYLYQHNKHFLISNYQPSIDLAYYLKYKRLFYKTRLKMALECGLQLLDAVSCLHSEGYIHSDIKPSNVLLTTIKRSKPDYQYPQFLLIDFGLVRKAGQTPHAQQKNFEHPFVLVYSPPEQVLGVHELTSYPSDLYNIALLIYEMITKEPVYESHLSVKLMYLQTSYPLPEHKLIPYELMAILKKAAAKYHFKKPPNHYSRKEVFDRLAWGITQRYQSADEFKQALLTFKNNYFNHE